MAFDDAAWAPRITVIMALWREDSPEYFRQSVASIQAQSFEDWECLIVADGELSPELDASVAEALGDARIRLIPLEGHRGPAATRNMGVQQARGAAIAILDADDIALPERFEKEWAALEEHAADVVGSWVGLINEAGETIGTRELPASYEAIRDMLWWRNPIAHSSALVRTAALKKHPYEEALRYGEDYRLWVTLALHDYRLINLPEVLVHYRVKEDPKSHGGKWHRAWSDLSNRMGALLLYSAPTALCRQPLVALSVLARLAPPPVWRVLRRFRDRFSAGRW